MAYTTINKASDYFNTKLYTGNNSTNAVTGVGFQPDFVWLKPRNLADNHRLMNAVSGADKYLISNSNSAEGDPGSNFSSFDSDGFTLGGSDNGWNSSSYNYVSWNWKGNGSGSSNTDGSITSTVSANTTAGFSIVTYTGTGANATVGHGLGVAPSVYFVKRTDTTGDWLGYFKSQGAGKNLRLNTTDALDSNTTMWQNTDPTSSVFYVGSTAEANGSSNTFVAYCFAEKKGFSKFGKYTGNGSNDGSFIYTGFKPAWVLIKKPSTAEAWHLYDAKRNPYNLVDKRLFPNSSNAESVSGTPPVAIDFLSNGFKNRALHDNLNTNGSEYIYMAFAEAPLVGSNNVPCTAR